MKRFLLVLVVALAVSAQAANARERPILRWLLGKPAATSCNGCQAPYEPTKAGPISAAVVQAGVAVEQTGIAIQRFGVLIPGAIRPRFDLVCPNCSNR